ncbi:MAG: lipoate--protein ligase family protein [Bifidobacteriaceae bacterium]|nr:lipoate--protein ligase family protein [Bifidobacteriaceae bacterium]
MRRRGVFKVPGGKLVAVEFEIRSGLLTDVQVSGDFFLEPAGALDRIIRALEGTSQQANLPALTQTITTALADDDVLIGFDARAVGIAVRRALGKSTTWSDHTFELIVDGPRSPACHMALDQVYAEALGAGRRGPTLRVWQWGGRAVIIGSYQSLRNEVDLDAAASHGVEVVRRISGGGAMFVEPGNTITYSLVVPGSLVDGLSFEASYEFLDRWVVEALIELGVEASYQPINDIASPAGKIAGAAQRRMADGTVLHHVTMAYDIDAAKMTKVLRIGREKLSDKGTVSAVKRVDPLRSQTGLSREAVIDALVGYFARHRELVPSAPRPEELTAAEALVQSKFSSPSWTARIP